MDAIQLKKVLSILKVHWALQAKHTHGHSVGGITYIIDGVAKPVAVVGDAIFAGSMGGGMISYEDAYGLIAKKP